MPQEVVRPPYHVYDTEPWSFSLPPEPTSEESDEDNIEVNHLVTVQRAHAKTKTSFEQIEWEWDGTAAQKKQIESFGFDDASTQRGRKVLGGILNTVWEKLDRVARRGYRESHSELRDVPRGYRDTPHKYGDVWIGRGASLLKGQNEDTGKIGNKNGAIPYWHFLIAAVWHLSPTS